MLISFKLFGFRLLFNGLFTNINNIKLFFKDILILTDLTCIRNSLSNQLVGILGFGFVLKLNIYCLSFKRNGILRKKDNGLLFV